jgi:hypothetical protein
MSNKFDRLGARIYAVTFLEYTSALQNCVSYNPTHEIGKAEYIYTEQGTGKILVSETNIDKIKKFGIKDLTFVGYLPDNLFYL